MASLRRGLAPRSHLRLVILHVLPTIADLVQEVGPVIKSDLVFDMLSHVFICNLKFGEFALRIGLLNEIGLILILLRLFLNESTMRAEFLFDFT